MTHRKIRMRSSGFTLVELLVVVLMIAVLTSIGLPKYQKTIEASKVSTAMDAMKAVARAQERYRLKYGIYSDTMDNLDVDTSNFGQGTTESLYLPASPGDSYSVVARIRCKSSCSFMFVITSKFQNNPPSYNCIRSYSESSAYDPANPANRSCTDLLVTP